MQMKRIKRVLALCAVFFLAFGSITAYATDVTTSFTLKGGAASSVSGAYTKYVSNNRRLYFHPQRKNIYTTSHWPSGVKINFRGRTNVDKNNATELRTVTGAGDYTATYYSNSGYVGNKYRIASNMPSNSTCSTAYITVYWTP